MENILNQYTLRNKKEIITDINLLISNKNIVIGQDLFYFLKSIENYDFRINITKILDFVIITIMTDRNRPTYKFYFNNKYKLIGFSEI